MRFNASVKVLVTNCSDSSDLRRGKYTINDKIFINDAGLGPKDIDQSRQAAWRRSTKGA